MNINTSVSTKDRKPLVSALVELLAQPPSYDGPPSYAYHVGDYVVDRHGNVIVPDEASDETIQWLRDKLTEKGFEIDPPEAQPTTQDEDEAVGSEDGTDSSENPTEAAESPETVNTAEEPDVGETDKDKADPDGSEADSNEAETEADAEDASPEETTEDESSAESPEELDAPGDDKTRITLSLPRFQFTLQAIERLKAIVKSKQTLLKKALGTDTLVIQFTDDKVLFPWFCDHGLPGEVDAYSKLVFAIAKLAVNQKRASAEERQTNNEKLAMRLFLIRLGFIGDEFKTARAILTRNFSGSSAWQNGPNRANLSVTLSAPEVFYPNAVATDESKKEGADE